MGDPYRENSNASRLVKVKGICVLVEQLAAVVASRYVGASQLEVYLKTGEHITLNFNSEGAADEYYRTLTQALELT